MTNAVGLFSFPPKKKTRQFGRVFLFRGKKILEDVMKIDQALKDIAQGVESVRKGAGR